VQSDDVVRYAYARVSVRRIILKRYTHEILGEGRTWHCRKSLPRSTGYWMKSTTVVYFFTFFLHPSRRRVDDNGLEERDCLLIVLKRCRRQQPLPAHTVINPMLPIDAPNANRSITVPESVNKVGGRHTRKHVEPGGS
jgi:hypothetical protein